MAETKFWNPQNKKGNVKSPIAGGPKNGGVKKVAAKKLGKGGLVLLVVVGILGLIGFFFIIKPGFVVLSKIDALKQDSEAIKVALSSRDLLEFEEALNKTEVDLEALRKARDENYAWARNFGPTKNYYSDSDHFIEAGLHGVKAGREFYVVVQPFADALGLRISEEQEVEELGLAEAFAAWVAAMPVVAEDSDAIIAEFAAVGDELSYVDASRYPEEFRGTPVRSLIQQAQGSLSQVNEYAPDIKSALNIVPRLLGVDMGEKRYMIIMQNDKEMRATGGFWTFISTFKISNGLLNSDFTSYNSYYVDDVLNVIDAYHTFPTVPQAYKTHLKVERLFARDANVSPDLPTSVDQFLEFWNLAQPIAPAQIKPVDGVIVIDTIVLEELLEVTGPATVNGVTYTADNVVLELENLASLALAEQVNRKKILGDLMEAMLVNVFESESNLWPSIIEKGFDLAFRKHVAAVMFDDEAQALLEKYNLAGNVVENVEGDYAFVVQTNLGGDKTNWFTHKDVTHTLENVDGKYLRTVHLKYTYEEPAPEFGAFVKRFRDWVRLYVPAGAELVSVEGSADAPGEGEELGKKFFHGYIEAGPGETVELTFKYYLPEGVVKDGEYKLYIQKQLGITQEKHTVIVNGKSEEINLKYDKKYKTKL